MHDIISFPGATSCDKILYLCSMNGMCYYKDNHVIKKGFFVNSMVKKMGTCVEGEVWSSDKE